MRSVAFLVLVYSAFLFSLFAHGEGPVKVGSKVFTESVILGELTAQIGNAAGAKCEHVSQLGGTRVVWDALFNGQIDVYPEYTGTILQELLPGTKPDDLRTELAKRGIGIISSLGFNDTYALGMAESRANALRIRRISDLSTHPDLTVGMSNEFLERKDGWPLVRDIYGLNRLHVTGLDHDLAYRALAQGTTDVTDLYTTDAEIAYYHLRILADDRHVFPNYDAVLLYRLDLAARSPRLVAALQKLQGAISQKEMIEMNAACKLGKLPEWKVAHEFLLRHGLVTGESEQGGLLSLFWQRTREHCLLVAISLLSAIVVAVPLGVISFKHPAVGKLVLTLVAIIYTIPTLALLVFMIPLLGIGTWPAISALFLYALLPIVRNTHAGLAGIPRSLRISAVVLGLSPATQLWRVELPLAAPSILAGIKTAAVMNVGTATIGALIGAGGYGQFILTGVRLADNRLILLGAVPAAILALAVQGVFTLIEQALWGRSPASRQNP